MHKITVVSLGCGSRAELTLGAVDMLKKARKLILRTGETDAAKYLKEQNISFETLDHLHEDCEDFDELTESAVKSIAKAAARANVVYAVLDVLSDETALLLKARYPENVVFAGGGDGAAALLHAAGAGFPVRICTATALTVYGSQDALLVTEVSNKYLASECKLKLSTWYDDEDEVLFFPPAEKAERAFVRIPLCELDRQRKYDHTAAVYLPSQALESKRKYDFGDLVKVLSILRGENGCPWDLEQTHETLSKYLIEEAYEVSEAVRAGDWEHVADELGDVMLQVVFQADIARQYGTFTLDEVTTDICRKMISRHRHIFGQETLSSSEDVSAFWERIKQRERGNTTKAAVLRDVSRQLPALMRAEKVFKKAESLGLNTALLTQDKELGALMQTVRDMRRQGRSCEEEAALKLENYTNWVEKTENLAKNE